MINTSWQIFIWCLGLMSIFFLAFNLFISITYWVAEHYSKKIEKAEKTIKDIDGNV